MMRSLVLNCLSASFLLFASIQAEISVITALDQVHTALDQCDANSTLVLFDVDEVLIMCREPAYRRSNMRRHREISKRWWAQLTPEQQTEAMMLMIEKGDAVLLDRKTPEMLHHLQHSRGFPAIALTAAYSGDADGKDRFAQVRSDRLREFGIHFNHPYAQWDGTVFKDLKEARGTHPMFLGDVLFTNGRENSKGQVLLRFLDEVGSQISTVVFVDDSLKNLESVEAACRSRGIRHIGLHFVPEETDADAVDEETFKHKWQVLYEQLTASAAS